MYTYIKNKKIFLFKYVISINYLRNVDLIKKFKYLTILYYENLLIYKTNILQYLIWINLIKDNVYKAHSKENNLISLSNCFYIMILGNIKVN